MIKINQIRKWEPSNRFFIVIECKTDITDIVRYKIRYIEGFKTEIHPVKIIQLHSRIVE